MPQEVTSWSDTQKLLAFIVVGAFIIVVLLWMFLPPHTNDAATAVLNTLVGTLGSFAGMVMTFYFGSSRGERTSKDQTVAALQAANANVPPPTNGHAAPPPAPPPPAQPAAA